MSGKNSDFNVKLINSDVSRKRKASKTLSQIFDIRGKISSAMRKPERKSSSSSSTEH